MLGRSVVRMLRESGASDITALTHADLDIGDLDSLLSTLHEIHPSVVYNCAAMTAVDACETEFDRATRVNALAPGAMAGWCRDQGARLVHVSTDYVFNGQATSPIREDSALDPINAYGRSKLAGEEAVLAAGGGALIIRTAWVYSQDGKNFLRFVLDRMEKGEEVPVITDQTGSPTYAWDIALAISRLLESGAGGIFHVVNTGACTWWDFASHLAACAGLEGPMRPIVSADLNRPAPRPSYSVLDTSRFAETTGSPMRSWQEAARFCVEQWRALK